jgi:hypothetical protein
MTTFRPLAAPERDQRGAPRSRDGSNGARRRTIPARFASSRAVRARRLRAQPGRDPRAQLWRVLQQVVETGPRALAAWAAPFGSRVRGEVGIVLVPLPMIGDAGGLVRCCACKAEACAVRFRPATRDPDARAALTDRKSKAPSRRRRRRGPSRPTGANGSLG